MKYLIILSLLSLSFTAKSQCCVYINNVEIIPPSPTTSDIVKVVTTVTTTNQGLLISSSHAVSGNTIDVEACYFNGLLPATQTYYDTLTIGALPAGNYTVDFTAYESGDPVCDYVDSTTTDTSFVVIENQASLNPINQQIGKLFPNPSNGSFTVQLPDGIQATRVKIRSISGEIIEQMDFSEKMNLNLAAGIYLIEFLEDDRTIGYRRFSIQ